MSYWKLGYFPLQLYHLESRWRNSHVLVYHGPLLIHLLGVVPSTFQMVYFFWGIRANDANSRHWFLDSPKKGASQEHRAWPLAQCLGAPLTSMMCHGLAKWWKHGPVKTASSKKRWFFEGHNKNLCGFFMSVHKVRLIYDLRHLYTWFSLNSPLCNMIWFYRSFQMPLLHL